MISYTIELVNTRPGDGTGQGSAYQYTVWASHNHTKTVSNDDPESTNTWTNEPYALGAPDGPYATSLASSQGDDLGIGGFLLDPQLGNITGVTATIYVRELQDLANNYLEYHLYIDDNDVVTQTQRYTQSHFSQPLGSDYVLEINLSDVDWDWSHFQDDRTEALLTAGKYRGTPAQR